MKAIVLSGSSEVPQLELRKVDRPEPKPGELLIRVGAAGINRAELTAPRRSGHAGHPQGIPGGELAGTVEAVGDGAISRFKPGDRIMALGNGSYAQYTCVDERLAVAVPAGMELTTAAALPAWFMTAHNAVVTEGRLQSGETILIQGATSGVGMAAALIARQFGAGRIIGIARSAEKLEQLEGRVIDRGFVSTGPWVEQVGELTNGKGANLVIDMVGAGALGGNLSAAAVAGRIVAVGRLGGPEDTIDINMLAMKRIRLIGVSFRLRTLDERVAVAEAFARDVLPAVVAGKIVPPVDRIFPMREVTQAQNYVRSNAHSGKAVLKIEGGD